MPSTVIDRLDRLVRLATRNGFEVRREPTGRGTSWCELRGRPVLFVDLAQTAADQCEAIREVLQQVAVRS